MNLVKKITQIFFLIFLASFLASCEEGCVEADEFDTLSFTVESNPTNDGVAGNYDPVNGGQTAEWHETGLRSNGDQFLIQLSGSWTPWNGDDLDDAAMTNLTRCNFCAKKPSPASPNCICYADQTPAIETNASGDPISTDSSYCNNYTNQNNPIACSCTKDPAYGTSIDYSTYHFPLNFYNKDQTTKEANSQQACKFDRGMGLYIGLFGRRGTDVPTRLYHMFSEEAICNVRRNANNQCLNEDGVDITRYVFRSANDRIFMKDDGNGNTDNNTDTSNDIYHGSNEYLKLKIYDSYYSDNYGQYYISILKGVGDAADSGLLEFLVSLVEDILLGAEGSDGQRDGGIIQYMYKAIVQDTSFIIALQVALSIYIAVYGAAYLYGLVEMDRKEVMGRTLKIGLILLFTSSSSWNLYNTIVVAFFKDSMDYVVAMVMSLSDANQDPSSMIVISQMDQASDASNATRFSYVDLTIKKLFANNTAKKIFGLFFGTYYGILLIPLIYFLIGFFLYVMLVVASIYMISIMKIVFVLSLGPIFMCLSLFTHTSSMFKNWLGFLGARSLEVILLFAVLYNFLILIDQGFTDLLYYRACRESYDFGLFTINILKSDIASRSLIVWLVDLANVGGLIFITWLVIEKVGDLAGSLISVNIGGTSSKGGASSFKMAGAAMKEVGGLAMQAASAGLGAAAIGATFAAKQGTEIARATGIAGALARATDSIPFSSPRSMYRNNFIDSAISKAQAEAKSKGLTGKDADQFIRNSVVENMQNLMSRPDQGSNPKISESKPLRAALAGIDMKTIADRLDKKLVQDPLKQFIKDESKKLKNADADKILGAKEMRAELRKRAEAWADKNLSIGSERVAELVAKRDGEGKSQMNAIEREIKGLIKQESELTPAEAAKRFAGNPELQNKYLQSLKDKEFKQAMKNEAAFKTSGAKVSDLWNNPGKLQTAAKLIDDTLKVPRMASNLLGRGYNALKRDNFNNPQIAQESFIRNLRNEERGGLYKTSDPLFCNPLNRSNLADKAMGSLGTVANKALGYAGISVMDKNNTLAARTEAAEKKAMLSYLATNAAEPTKKEDQKRQFYQNQLRKMATKDLAKEAFQIGKLERGGNASQATARRQYLFQQEIALLGKSDMSLFEKAARMDYLSQKLGLDGGPTDPNRIDFQSALANAHSDKVEAEANRIQDNLTAAGGDVKKLEAVKAEAAKLQAMNAGLFATGQAFDPKSSDPLAKAYNNQLKKVESALVKKSQIATVKKGGNFVAPKATAKQIIAARGRSLFDRAAVAAEKKDRAKTAETVHTKQIKAQERISLLNKNIGEKEEKAKKTAESDKALKAQREKLMKDVTGLGNRRKADHQKLLDAKAKEVAEEQKKRAAEKLAARIADTSLPKLSPEEEKDEEEKFLEAEKKETLRDSLLRMTEDQRKELLKPSEKLPQEEKLRQTLKSLEVKRKEAVIARTKAATALKVLNKLSPQDKNSAIKALETLANTSNTVKDRKSAEGTLRALEQAGKLSAKDRAKAAADLKEVMDHEAVAVAKKKEADKALEKLSEEERKKALDILKALAESKPGPDRQAAESRLEAFEDARKLSAEEKDKAAIAAKALMEAEKLAAVEKEKMDKALEKLSAEAKANALKTLADAKSEEEKLAAKAALNKLSADALKAYEALTKAEDLAVEKKAEALKALEKFSAQEREDALKALKALAEAENKLEKDRQAAEGRLKDFEDARKLSVEEKNKAVIAAKNLEEAEKSAATEKEKIAKALEKLSPKDKESALSALTILTDNTKSVEEKQNAAKVLQAWVDAKEWLGAEKIAAEERANLEAANKAVKEAEKIAAEERIQVGIAQKAETDANNKLDLKKLEAAAALNAIEEARKLSFEEDIRKAEAATRMALDAEKSALDKRAKIGAGLSLDDKEKESVLNALKTLANSEKSAKERQEAEDVLKTLADAGKLSVADKEQALQALNAKAAAEKLVAAEKEKFDLAAKALEEARKAAEENRTQSLKALSDAEKLSVEERKNVVQGLLSLMSNEQKNNLAQAGLERMVTEEQNAKRLEEAVARILEEEKRKAAEAKAIAKLDAEEEQRRKSSDAASERTPKEKKEELKKATDEILQDNLNIAINKFTLEQRNEILKADAEKVLKDKDINLAGMSEVDRNKALADAQAKLTLPQQNDILGSAIGKSEVKAYVDKMTPEARAIILDTAVGTEIATSIKKAISEVSISEINSTTAVAGKVDAVFSSGGSALSNSDFSKALETKTPEELAKWRQAVDLIVKDFKVEFGGSIADLMMKGFDIGLKPSNILPGGDPKTDGTDPSAAASLKTAQTQMNMKYKMTKMNMKIKQFELDQAKDAGKSEEEIADLKKQVDDLEKEFGSISAACDKLKAQIEK